MSVPELKTLLTIHLNVEEPKQIYTTPQGSLSEFSFNVDPVERVFDILT